MMKKCKNEIAKKNVAQNKHFLDLANSDMNFKHLEQTWTNLIQRAYTLSIFHEELNEDLQG